MAKTWTTPIGDIISLFILLSLLSISSNAQYRQPSQRFHPCEHSSCYPATGNLLIGRENRLHATSTCGEKRPERYCIVSHLEEKKCFKCETTSATEHVPSLNHAVRNIIYKYMRGTKEINWWQSENGHENVTIQLDLEAEFHFTHLIIVFQTFRPAAMFIERSYDFGKSWHIYRHFAHSCTESFPGVPTEAKNITDIICDNRYSGVEPSKNGEVIYRVLPPNIKIPNPYAEHIQNMLKMTNLRINFTRLHSLGDTLLDDRHEIQEKYYYAINNMVVRGSCSCYGHASRCLPLDGSRRGEIDMVHGRCECTHNTKGLNCEECEDFYNDLPWKPALGKQTNACKRCNCNNHATSCHFDQDVYEKSGRISGGVCDSCQHNTQGQHCEQCSAFFYRDPREDIQSPYVCKPCDCDPRGSLDEGICDSNSDEANGIMAGACHCKSHVKGRRCDQCREGFWNFTESSPEGCQACTCNTLGTIDNLGCNVWTGECSCKQYVTGRDCNECLPEHYGLSESPEGCSPCDCDAGGAVDNNCDVMTGQCKCRDHMTGRTCSEPRQNYFIPQLHKIYEAEIPFTLCDDQYSVGNCSIVIRDRPRDRQPTWTGPGFIRAHEGTELKFTIDDIPKTMNYDVQIRYSPQIKGDWDDVRISIIRPDPYDPEGDCANSHPSREVNIHTTLAEYELSKIALEDICLEQGKTYKFIVSFQQHNPYDNDPAAQILIDSIVLLPRIEVTPIFVNPEESEKFVHLGCNETYYSVNFHDNINDDCKKMFQSISSVVFDGAQPCECNPTGSTTKKCDDYGGYCHCKPYVFGRQCDKCAPGTYGFGPEGCTPCDCNSIGSKDNECDLITGQCNCHPNTYGRECNQCQPGFWQFPKCIGCECNGHAPTCDSRTGECISCQDFTTGYKCDRCVEGYYGNPRLGSEIGCRPCRCPDTIASGHSYASECALTSNNDMVCYCEEGYSGARCDVCADNFYGNPEKPGGICQRCECNDNVDLSRPGNCNSKTGKCQQCLYDTEGDHCEYCRDGYFGDASKHDCQQCDCDVLGTNASIGHCNRYTGQCPCLKNVQGQRCDECIENHWKIASGDGCEACGCDSVGSSSEQCNPYDGQCECKKGFGGRQCNQCETNFWGNPNVQCNACDCDPYGSLTEQCDRTTGKCICNEGIGGYKCDECDRGYLGKAPYCETCGECFDNWDMILDGLKMETDEIIENAKKVKKLGATGAYKKEFDAMSKKIDMIQQLLDNTTISDTEVERIENSISELRLDLDEQLAKLQMAEKMLEEIGSSISLQNIALDDLSRKSEEVKIQTRYLKENATKLQEANVEGALNLTRQAHVRVLQLEEDNKKIQELNDNAERQCKRTDTYVKKKSDDFARMFKENAETLDKFQDDLDSLNARIPDLNDRICDKRGDPCDTNCGGADCAGHCGGLNCEKGAMTRADKALSFAKSTEKNIMEKEEKANEIIRAMSQAKANASEAYKKASKIYETAQLEFNKSEALIKESNQLINNLTEVINDKSASPGEIMQLAMKILGFNLQFNPEQIQLLAQEIQNLLQNMENVDQIIEETKTHLEDVEELKLNALSMKERAEKALEDAKKVIKSLEDAEAAQKLAQAAIKKANEDISSAQIDLDDIDLETKDGQERANATGDIVTDLTNRLSEIRKAFFKNELDANEIKENADGVKESANAAHDLATQLKNNYKSANESLTVKAIASESARERAQALLKRASKITVDTNNKLKELQGMDDIYKSNDRELELLQAKIISFNQQIEENLHKIQERSEYYRSCTS